MALSAAFPLDIDAAITLALSNFTIADENGVQQPVPVIYSTPEVEFFAEVHPCIMFYQASVAPDFTRISNDKLYANQAYDVNGKVTRVDIRDDSDPITIHYDIRIYTLYEVDSRQLMKSIMTTFPLRGTISVNGSLLDIFLEKQADLTKNQGSLNMSSMKLLEKASQREQIQSLRYKIYTAMDVHKPVTVSIPSNVVVNTNSM